MRTTTDLATMARCDIHRMGHEAVIARDFDTIAALFADEFEFIDHPAGQTHRSTDTLREVMKEWYEAVPDMRFEGAEYWDTGECSIARFFVRGTQQGPLGPFPASGKSFVGAMMEIAWFGEDGRCTRMEQVYDQLSMLAQLGHVPMPE